jgi:hypothetical protein
MTDKYSLAYLNIDELAELSAPATGDWLVIYDVSTGEFKKIDAEYYAAA